MLEPFLKWAGGKRWLAHRHGDLMPTTFRRYIEPFLGSGAVFFRILPKRAILSDRNAELVETYMEIKNHAGRIHAKLRFFQQRHSKDFYYVTRASRPRDPLDRAARFIYLNRTCFNGLYRVNRQGAFNVPLGSKTLVEFPDGYLQSVSDALKHATLRVSDFAEVLDEARNGDFVYVDPPYTVMHNANNFIKYNASLFSWDDQVRLSVAVKRAARRGALVMLSNADHRCVTALYRGFGTHHKVERASVLAGTATSRRRTTELLITSY